MDSERERMITLIDKIESLHPTITRLSKCFREDLDKQYESNINSESAEYWRLTTYGNALVRIRLILEDNFKVIETIGLVAVTRYIFELTLWLKLFEVDVNYALVYQRRMLEGQKRYYEDTLKQHIREVELLQAFGEEDSQKTNQAIEEIRSNSDLTPEQVSAFFKQARDEIDAKAARAFSIYTDDAKTNGYVVQAQFIESEAIPELKKGVHSLQKGLDDFDKKNSSLVNGLLKCGSWDRMAEKVSMSHEYEYIYSFTSKLLHCSPMSITTNQKRLEDNEAVVFLRYIHTKIRDIIDLAVKQPECKIRSM